MPALNDSTSTSNMDKGKMKTLDQFVKNGGASNGGEGEAEVGNGTNGASNSKATAGRRKFGENGFEEQGGYMAAKKAKLDNQFNQSLRIFGGDRRRASDIFKGLTIHINGYTNPPEPELREMFISNGGVLHPYCMSKTTYVIATNLSVPSKRLYGSKAVTPQWITDSIQAGKLLDVRKYKLYDLNQENKQMTLTQAFQSKKPNGLPNGISDVELELPVSEVNQCEAEADTDSTSTSETETETSDKKPCEENGSDEEFFECSQELFPSPDQASPKPVGPALLTANEEIDNSNDEHDKSKEVEPDSGGSDDTAPEDIVEDVADPEGHNKSSDSPTNKEERMKNATDVGFLEDFFGRSRLHLISEQKKDMQIFISNLRKNVSTHSFHNLRKFEEELDNNSIREANGSYLTENKCLMHIDLDCFFVSAGLLSRPHLRGKPVVVTHSSGKGQDSKSDIACASYEARKFGVKNGMWVGDAKRLCPTVEVISYDFDEYRRISQCFYEAVASITLDIEPNSVDEMVVDVTPILRAVNGSTPEDLANFFRRIILEETKCPASVGIGSNKLLAKLAVKQAKPDGVHYLKDKDAATYIENLNVRDLPGVGWSNEDKLSERFGVQTCGDLLKVSLKDLKAAFGEKTAEKMHSLCQGVDTTELKFGIDRPKSLSVDVNFGIRFTIEAEVTTFLMHICKELSSRAEKVQATSTHFTLKLLIRKKGAGDPLKPGGHGIVDSVTRSRSLFIPTRNWQEFHKTACSLIRLMRVPPEDYRGIGVTLSDLTFDCDNNGKKSVQRTLTDMSMSRGQKMLSILQKKNKPSATATSTDQRNGVEDVINIDSSNSNSSISNTDRPSTASNGRPTTEQNESVQNAVGNLPVDINVLRQLPREIAEEQCKFYGIKKELLDQVEEKIEENGDSGAKSEGQGNNNGQLDKYYDDVETVDQSFLSALPENLRQDVLLQLQEAKGRRPVDGSKNRSFDEQQPCTSKQAMERINRLNEPETVNGMSNGSSDIQIVKIIENKSPQKKNIGKEEAPLAQQITPIIDYSSKCPKAYDPQKFWNDDFDHQVLPPSHRLIVPALNGFTEVVDIRNLIREGLEVIKNPIPEEIESLENYFRELAANGWLNQTEVLLKFLKRRIVHLGNDSKWTPILNRIVEDTQKLCKTLYHGVLDLEV